MLYVLIPFIILQPAMWASMTWLEEQRNPNVEEVFICYLTFLNIVNYLVISIGLSRLFGVEL